MEEGLTFTDFITPYLPLISAVMGAILIGIFGVWNRKRGAVETRAPDVNEIWLKSETDHKALDIERRTRRHLEDLIYRLLAIFRCYVDRVRRGGSTDLNTKELELYNSSPSSFVKLEEK